eukprot:gene45814-62045_t
MVYSSLIPSFDWISLKGKSAQAITTLLKLQPKKALLVIKSDPNILLSPQRGGGRSSNSGASNTAGDEVFGVSLIRAGYETLVEAGY